MDPCKVIIHVLGEDFIWSQKNFLTFAMEIEIKMNFAREIEMMLLHEIVNLDKDSRKRNSTLPASF